MTNRPHYSRAEYLSDAVVHVAGVVAALAAVPVLITLTIQWRGDFTAVLGVSIYGGALIAMLLFSGLYNMLPHVRFTGLLRRLDHGAIYIKIAGTYTPLTLLSGSYGLGLLVGLWTAALAGCGLKAVDPGRYRWLALSLYLGMGWAGALIGWDMFATMSSTVLALILAGGVLYTAGVGFFLFNRLVFHNTIWHVFVLCATVLLFAAVTQHMADTSVTSTAAITSPGG